MAERERYVPRRVQELTEDLAQRPWEDDSGADQFRAFARLIAAMEHFEFYDREQQLIDAWDQATSDPEAASVVADELGGLLEDANYTQVTPDRLRETMDRESTVPLRLEVDLDDYEIIQIHRRGGDQRTIDASKLRGLVKRKRSIIVDDRVVVFTKIQPEASFVERGIDPSKRNLVPGDIMLKQFQHVPRADIEMLLPSTTVRYRLIDTFLVGFPALVSGLLVLATKLLPTLGLIALLFGAWLGLRNQEPKIDQAALVLLFGGAIAIGGFVVRQWTKVKNRKVAYLKTLSEVLYFRTLSTGPGVLHTLLASAEQQEVNEILLAYRFLCDAPEGLRVPELDERVETWLRGSCRRDIDFDVDDALDKVKAMGLLEGEEHLRVLPLADALVRIDERWDSLFTYNRQSSHA